MEFSEVLNLLKDGGGWVALIYLLWLFVNGKVMSSVQVAELRALSRELRELSTIIREYVDLQKERSDDLEQALQDMYEQAERNNVWRERVNLLITRMADAYERLAEVVSGDKAHNGERIRESLADTQE